MSQLEEPTHLALGKPVVEELVEFARKLSGGDAIDLMSIVNKGQWAAIGIPAPKHEKVPAVKKSK